MFPVSSFLDSAYASLAGISQKSCCALGGPIICQIIWMYLIMYFDYFIIVASAWLRH